MTIPDGAWGPADDAGFRYVIASIRTVHHSFPHWNKAVRVTLRDRNGEMDVVGIERPAGRNEPSSESTIDR